MVIGLGFRIRAMGLGVRAMGLGLGLRLGQAGREHFSALSAKEKYGGLTTTN